VTSYRTVASTGLAEIEVSRSRFLAEASRVSTEEEARAVIERIRREHPDASHHCTAFVLGPGRAIERSNDDGEPSGTAGAPILDALRGHALTDTLVVVTRWFGGTLLGTGGLARAYGDVARAALDAAGSIVRVLHRIAVVEIDHARAGRIEHDLRARGIEVLGVEYAAAVRMRMAVRPEDVGDLEHLVAETTGGEVSVILGEEIWRDM
jgi:uncharacterized YigZ family protein